MIRILFTCHGNICRSTMAEYVMKHLVHKAGLDEKFYIDSAGTSREELGNPVHYGTRKKLTQMGVFCGDHRARQMTRDDYNGFDLLIGMDKANIRNMTRICGGDTDGKIRLLLDYAYGGEVADPWSTGDFDATWRDVYAGCVGLMKSLGFESM